MSSRCLLLIVAAWSVVVGATGQRPPVGQNTMLPDWTVEFEILEPANQWMSNFVSLVSNRNISKLAEFSQILANMQTLETNEIVENMFRQGREKPGSTLFDIYLRLDSSVKSQATLWPTQTADSITSLILKTFDHDSIGCSKADIEHMLEFSKIFSAFGSLNWTMNNNLTTHILICYEKYRNAFVNIFRMFGHYLLDKHSRMSNFSVLRDLRRYRLLNIKKETHDKYMPEIVSVILNDIESPKPYNIEYSILTSVPSNYKSIIGARFEKLIVEPCTELNPFIRLVREYEEFVSVSGDRTTNPIYRELTSIVDRFDFCNQALNQTFMDNLINRYYVRFRTVARGKSNRAHP